MYDKDRGRWMTTGLPAALCILLWAVSGACQDTELSVALTGKYPPFSFYSEEGKLVGFDIDVSRAIAKYMDRKLDIVTTEWDGILAGLLAGKYHAIIGSMAITPERAKKVSFSAPYYISGAQIFIRREDTTRIQGIEHLADRRVGVVLGETYEHYLSSNHPEIEAITYKSSNDIFQDMENGRLDAFLTDRLVGLHQIRSARKPFAPAGPLLYQEKMGIPVRQTETELLASINSALAALKADGTLARIHTKWFSLLKEPRKAKAVSETSGMEASAVAGKLVEGFWITILVALVSLALGFTLALPAGVVLNAGHGVLYTIVRGITDFVRGTPVLVQLFFVYFGAPQVGIDLSPIVSAIVALTINAAAYMSEVIRSGLMAVGPGQKAAARALGLTRLDTFRFVVWPQAFRIAVPPLVNSSVALLKDTALISVISVGEVIREAQSIISVTYDPMRYYLIVAAMFFAFTYPLMKLADRMERSIRRKGFAHG
ncbi:MAG: ABC transporter permease subunit [Chitinivibrionales bacterium]|nr:ABC transporter permease subunit [Chitinivibrionales bacterium]MBD3356016.1 ABC transporter permease subunit [Chitinivibrionales bacterium]